jgi:hypothetical protein
MQEKENVNCINKQEIKEKIIRKSLLGKEVDTFMKAEC